MRFMTVVLPMPVLAAAVAFAALAAALAPAAALAATGVHTTYLWHMHQPIYWPDESAWTPGRYQTAYETLVTGTAQNDLAAIFGSDDRRGDYQHYPRDAVASMLDLPDGGAQVSFAGALMENVQSLADAGWNGGAYGLNWFGPYREARGWTTSAGKPRLEPVVVGFHHAIGPLMDDRAFRMELACAQAIYGEAWGAGEISRGFFPAEMCFSERLIPALADAGIEWSIVGDLHLARACAGYPYSANQDNCDPPNPADQVNPAQPDWTSHFISRGVTLKVPYPFGFTPHRAQYVDPATGEVSQIVVAPAANAMGWEEGYGLFGTGGIDAIAAANDPAQPMLVLFAHDGDNAWSGGYSYYYESVPQFSHAAAAAGYTPTTVATYLAQHPVPAGDIVHVEDGGWVNADGDFGSPQFINWNWPLVDATGQFDIPGGWAEDERNWAVLMAAQNVVETAEAIGGAPDPARVVDPLTAGTTPVERAWHYLLAGYESGYMYYGTALDMEVKATLACNEAIAAAQPVIDGGQDQTAPTVWLPQRLPWNPGGFGGGALWGYPGGNGAPMSRDFHVWTFIHDVSGLARVELMVRQDDDGVNDPATHVNEVYAGGPGVGVWTALPMNHRAMPLGEPWDIPGVDLTELPTVIADQYWLELTGYSEVLLDYYVEAEDVHGHIKRSPIQHVWVGSGDGGGDPSEAVWWEPAEPQAGQAMTVWYDPVGRPLDSAAEVLIHRGVNGWQQVVDEPMQRAAGDTAWSVTFTLPASATVTDFVFHDGAGVWDNNGGADWHVAVAGGSGGGGGFVMDGQLDDGVPAVAAADDLTLWAARDGDLLYVATEAAGIAPAGDRFLMVVTEPGATRAAPWAKAGQVQTPLRYLAAESSNGWAGWFDAADAVQSGGAHQAGHGAVLEGVLDLALLFPDGAPSDVWLAAAAYGTADGGALLAQAPAGDGDGDLQQAEYVRLGSDPSAAPDAPAPLALSLHPNPFNPQVSLAVTVPRPGPAEVAVYDATGRRVAVLHRGHAGAGALTLRWDGRDAAGRDCASGLYLVRVTAGGASATAKAVLVR